MRMPAASMMAHCGSCFSLPFHPCVRLLIHVRMMLTPSNFPSAAGCWEQCIVLLQTIPGVLLLLVPSCFLLKKGSWASLAILSLRRDSSFIGSRQRLQCISQACGDTSFWDVLSCSPVEMCPVLNSFSGLFCEFVQLFSEPLVSSWYPWHLLAISRLIGCGRHHLWYFLVLVLGPVLKALLSPLSWQNLCSWISLWAGLYPSAFVLEKGKVHNVS